MTAPMTSPVDLTAILGACGSFGAAGIAFVAVRRQARRDKLTEEHDKDATDVASWSTLNTALDREIQRLHTEQDRMREDYERKLSRQAEEYERKLTRQAQDNEQQLAIRDARITELQKDVESLQRSARLLRGQQHRDQAERDEAERDERA